VERVKTKKAKSYKNPIILKRSSLKLEKDAMQTYKYFLSFSYCALLDFTLHIYSNATNTEEYERNGNIHK
jgi:hypothetical protein